MPDNGVRTTEASQSEGRLKVDAGCCHGKKKCLKCAIKRTKDGKGGSGYNPPGYGATFAQGSIKLKMPSLTSGTKLKKLKKLKTISSKTKVKKTKVTSPYKRKKTTLLKGLLKKVKAR